MFPSMDNLAPEKLGFVYLCYSVSLDSMLLFRNFFQDNQYAKALFSVFKKAIRVSMVVFISIDLQLSEQELVPQYEGATDSGGHQVQDRVSSGECFGSHVCPCRPSFLESE